VDRRSGGRSAKDKRARDKRKGEAISGRALRTRMSRWGISGRRILFLIASVLLLLTAEEREREREREMCDLIKNFRIDPHGNLRSARWTIDDEL